MENYLNLMIIGATRYDIDGNRGGSLWAYSPAEADDDNRVGNEVMKIACAHGLWLGLHRRHHPGGVHGPRRVHRGNDHRGHLPGLHRDLATHGGRMGRPSTSENVEVKP